MITARAYHTATTLDNGKTLLAGGTSGNGVLASIELYDPLQGGWTNPPASARMASARRDHSATFFLDEEGKGYVLVVGGDNGSALDSAEIYDTAAGTWSPAPQPQPKLPARRRHTATLLGDHHRILIAGGGGEGGPLGSAVLFEMGVWAQVDDMAAPRSGHSATLLREGPLLIAGGDDGQEALSSIEIFDPVQAQWLPGAPPMAIARTGHTATLLHDGRVLLVGGRGGVGSAKALNTAEMYDPNPSDTPDAPPAEGRWCTIAARMGEARAGHTATLLDNGMVLIAGGDGDAGALSSAELYDPKRPSEKYPCDCDCGSWAQAGLLSEARAGHTAARLPDGSVLIAGGMGAVALASADVYEPATQCRTLSDCPESLICNDEKQCVPPEVTCTPGTDDCGPRPSIDGSCIAARGSPKGAGALVAAMTSLLAAIARRWRNRCHFNGWRR